MSSMFQLLKHYLPLCVLRHTDVRGDDRVSSEALGTLTEHAQVITWSGSCCRKSEQTCKGQEAGRHGKGLYGLYTNMVQAILLTKRTERQRDRETVAFWEKMFPLGIRLTIHNSPPWPICLRRVSPRAVWGCCHVAWCSFPVQAVHNTRTWFSVYIQALNWKAINCRSV